MAITTTTVTARSQGTIIVPIYKTPYITTNNNQLFSRPSFHAALMHSSPNTPGIGSAPLTSFRCELFTPLSKTETIVGAGTVGGGNTHMIFGNRIYMRINNGAVFKPFYTYILPCFFTTSLTITNPAPNYPYIQNYNDSLLVASTLSAPALFNINGSIVPGGFFRDGTGGHQVISLWPRTSLVPTIIEIPGWPFPTNPSSWLYNIPDLASGFNSGLYGTGNPDGSVNLGIFTSIPGGNLNERTVNWDDAQIATALTGGNFLDAQMTTFGHLILGRTNFEDQGSTCILLSTDGTKYYRIKFTNGGGLASAAAVIAADYYAKIDIQGNFYLRSAAATTDLYSSAGIPLFSIPMPTGGLRPIGLPCFSPCVPPIYLE